MIHAPIPLGRIAVQDALPWEMLALAGPLYADGAGQPRIARSVAHAGSSFLTGQEGPIRVLRVRELPAGIGRPWTTNGPRRAPQARDGGVFRRVLDRISCRVYEAAAHAVPRAFGLAKSSVWRRFIRGGAPAFETRHERRHHDAQWLARPLTGQSLADDQVAIAHGVTTTGRRSRKSSPRSTSRPPDAWRKALRRPAHGTASVFSSNSAPAARPRTVERVMARDEAKTHCVKGVKLLPIRVQPRPRSYGNFRVPEFGSTSDVGVTWT